MPAMEVLSNIPDQVSIQVVIHSYSSRMLVFGDAFWYALPELTQFTQLYIVICILKLTEEGAP